MELFLNFYVLYIQRDVYADINRLIPLKKGGIFLEKP